MKEQNYFIITFKYIEVFNLIRKIINSVKDKSFLKKVRIKVRIFILPKIIKQKKSLDFDMYNLYVKYTSYYPTADKIDFNRLEKKRFSHKGLFELEKKYPLIYDFVMYYVFQHQELKKYDLTIYNNFIGIAKKTEFKNMSQLSMLALSRFFITVGIYELSKVFRDIHLELLLENKSKDFYSKTAYLLGLFDKLDTSTLSFQKHDFNDKTTHYYSILTGSKVFKVNQSNDLSFYDVVKGKNIAIIGPATDDELNFELLLKEYDYIVLVNFSDKTKLDKAVPSERLISYYNGNRLIDFNKSNREDILSIPKYSVFAPAFGGTAEVIQDRSILTNNNCRKLVSYHEYYLMGYPNMLQYILFDLLTFNPRQLKIFNVNFFLSFASYDEDYITSHESKKTVFDRWHSHATHNILSQYRLTRILLNHPVVSFSDKVYSVLTLGEDEYLSRMKQEYVDKFLH